MVDVYHPTVPNGPLDVPPSQLDEWIEAGWSKSPVPDPVPGENQPNE